MIAWHDVERAEPEFAQRVRGLFVAHRHKTIATLRADGSPRISGIEATFEDGQLTFGSMPDARKGVDLRRDPRFALHSATVDPVEGSERLWPGEAKISGRAELTTQGSDGDLFYADITEVVHPPQRERHDARHRVVDSQAGPTQHRAWVVVPSLRAYGVSVQVKRTVHIVIVEVDEG